MSAGYTKGPWKVGRFSSIVGCPVLAQPDPKKNSVVIAGVHGAFGDDYLGEVEANARLIAAAPELLEALQEIMNERWSPAGRSERVSDLARAAISKAGGSS